MTSLKDAVGCVATLTFDYNGTRYTLPFNVLEIEQRCDPRSLSDSFGPYITGPVRVRIEGVQVDPATVSAVPTAKSKRKTAHQMPAALARD
jgi:hypothetical protein